MIILFFIFATLIILYILLPLFSSKKDFYSVSEENEREKLFLKKAEIFNSLRDLEYDLREGKITSEDYTILKEKLSEEAIKILKEEDKE